MSKLMTRIASFVASQRVRMRPSALALLGVSTLVAALPFVSGCSGGCSSEQPTKEPEPILDRTKDPDYIEKLKARHEVQNEIVRRAGAIARELEAARAEDPESEKTKELERRHEEISAELEKDRIVNMAIIRERMQKELSDRAKAKEKAAK